LLFYTKNNKKNNKNQLFQHIPCKDFTLRTTRAKTRKQEEDKINKTFNKYPVYNNYSAVIFSKKNIPGNRFFSKVELDNAEKEEFFKKLRIVYSNRYFCFIDVFLRR